MHGFNEKQSLNIARYIIEPKDDKKEIAYNEDLQST